MAKETQYYGTPKGRSFLTALAGNDPRYSDVNPLEVKAKFDEMPTKDVVERVDLALTGLSYREREVIKLRYGIGDGDSYTLEEVATIFKVTRERIRQVEAKTIRKIIGKGLEGITD
jgi:DNA-directed RNA polymerase sigma subunit (sigma70/sigma32)